MSYILDALKKSQSDRELGRVPTLSSGAHLTTHHATKTSTWSIAAVALASIAVLIALYAAVGPRFGAILTPAPPQDRTGPLEQASTTATLPLADQQRPTAQSVPPTPLRGSAVPPSSQGALARTMESQQQPPILDEAALRDQVERFESEQPTAPLRHESRAPTSAFSPGSGLGPTVPPDVRRDILEFKRQAQRDTGKKERLAPKSTPAATPDLREPLALPPRPVGASAPPPAEPAASAPPVRSQPPAPSPATVGPGPVQPRPGTEGGGRQQSVRLTVHVYAEEPAKRFVIINSQRVREGDRTDDGILVEEIRPDGVMLSSQGQTFFRPR